MFQPNNLQSDADLENYDPPVRAAAKHPRRAGLLILAFSSLITKFFIIDEYQRIKDTHPDNISIHPELIIVAYVLGIVGLSYLIWGRKAVLFLGKKRNERGQFRPLQMLLAFLLVGMGIGLYFWFQNQLSLLGYTF